MSDIKKALRTVEVQLNKMKRTDPGHAQKASQAKTTPCRNDQDKLDHEVSGYMDI